jgi:quercetin dioxygenase-like cupin family protein
MNGKTLKAAMAAAGLAAVASVGTALATPGSGIVGTLLARGSIANDLKLVVPQSTVRTKTIKTRDRKGTVHVKKVKQNVIVDRAVMSCTASRTCDVVFQLVTIQPGGTAGWHSHPGPFLASVKSGTVTLYDGSDKSCAPHAYGVGQSFMDSGEVHIARNEGSVPAEFYLAYLVPAGANPLRIDQPSPGNCSF